MTERLTDERLAELRTIADSAAAWFPGRWEHLPGIDWEALVASKEASIADVGSPVCAAHIAAFDPPTVIALLDAVRERDGYRESLREGPGPEYRCEECRIHHWPCPTVKAARGETA